MKSQKIERGILKDKVRSINSVCILRSAEVHWYEAHGISRKKMKIKHFLD